MKLNIRSCVFFSIFMASSVMAAGDHAGDHHGNSNAIGQAGNAAQVTRSVKVNMTDEMRFVPSTLSVKRGETIRITILNSGKLKHEMVLGTEAELKEHYEVMKKFPEMEHADAGRVTLQPGKTGEIIWKFTRAGNIDFACLQPGHYDAGMKGMFKVSKQSKPKKLDNHDTHPH